MRTNYYTITTRINMDNSLKEYYEPYIMDYNKIYRIMWRMLNSDDFSERFGTESKFATYISIHYGFDSSTISSMMCDIKTHRKRLKALKKTEMQQYKYKIKSIENKIDCIKNKINSLKDKVIKNNVSKQELNKYRFLKGQLYNTQNELNKYKQKYSNCQYRIKNDIYPYSFGGKKIFQAQFDLKNNGYRNHNEWYKDYINKRDKNIFYLGRRKDKCGNHRCQLKYIPILDVFFLKIRKENVYCESDMALRDKYLFINEVNFKHLHNELKSIVMSYDGKSGGDVPLNFRIYRKNKKWYLQCIFKIEYTENKVITSYKNGTIGLDFNSGFIISSETDKHGNLLGIKRYDLRFHGKANKSNTELQQSISQIVKYAKIKGKDIIIEDLDFKIKRSQLNNSYSIRGKRYNKMLVLLDSRRFKERMINCCHRNQVMLHIVKPYYTSKIGMKKYNYHKKLTTHQSASYVIARKGQGFVDRLVA